MRKSRVRLTTGESGHKRTKRSRKFKWEAPPPSVNYAKLRWERYEALFKAQQRRLQFRVDQEAIKPNVLIQKGDKLIARITRVLRPQVFAVDIMPGFAGYLVVDGSERSNVYPGRYVFVTVIEGGLDMVVGLRPPTQEERKVISS